MRGFIIVLDSFGIGFEPDANKFGDVGSNTLKSISKSKYFDIPNLKKLGIANIDSVDFLENENTIGSYARLRELSMGKDTTIGHWEMAGIVSKTPLPTFPNGFPKEVIDKFENAIGIGTLCNKAYSGTEVIKDYGDEHLKTGKPIVYTSADSVFQIAAHEEIISDEELYSFCRTARKILTGKYGVGRVIARPFVGTSGNYTRTPRRHDFSLAPPKDTMLNALQNQKIKTYAIGKIFDIFAGSGIDEHQFTTGNTEGIKLTLDKTRENFNGICYTNLVDCDMLYGHRRDVDGYAKAISEFDKCLPELINNLKNDDFLIISADHGCDPAYKGTDHTREYVPLLIYGKKLKSVNLGTIDGFGTVAKTVCDLFGVKNKLEGKSVFEEIN